MTSTHRSASPLRARLAWLFGLALSACSGNTTVTGLCESDAQCTLPGTRCDVEAGRCVCASDEACETGFFCNNAGVCQALAGCTSNRDCPDETFCDALSGICLAGPAEVLGSACGLSSHCPYGSVCDSGSCVEGCFDDGDCALGVACLDGRCQPGVCSEDAFCDFGQACNDAGECKDDFRGPYCRGCTQRTAANPEPCDGPRNFCLVNNRELGGFTNFCGVDCSLGQPCPNGFACNGVLILTQDVCRGSAQCQCNPNQLRFAEATCTVPQPCTPEGPNSDSCAVEGVAACNGGTEGGPNSCIVQRGNLEGNCTCTTDDECAEGATCTSGLCCSGTVRPERQCVGGEGTVSGFCTCATDDDCPRDNCDGSRGACAITGRPCTPGNDDCGPIACVDGACLIGQNCAPEQGLSCSDVSGE